MNDFQRPGGIVSASVDAYTGFKPSSYSRQQVQDLYIKGTTPGDDPYIRGVDVTLGTDGKTYRWIDGCTGDKERKGFLILNDADAGHDTWQAANKGWITRAKRDQDDPPDSSVSVGYVAQQLGFSAGLYQTVFNSVTFALEYFGAQFTWFDRTEMLADGSTAVVRPRQFVNFVNAGATFVW